MASPQLSCYHVAPCAGSRAVLAFYSKNQRRFYPVAAIGEALGADGNPFPRISFSPLPHLPDETALSRG